MAVTQIIDQGSYLEVYTSTTKYVTIPKSQIKLRLAGNVVFLYDNSDSVRIPDVAEQQVYRLLFGSITAPATASANALLLAILAMLNTGGSITGYATAANQVLEIAAINAVTAALNNKLDITSTAQANLVKGGSTLNDIVGQLSNIAIYTNRPNNRQSTAYQTAVFIGNFPNAAAAAAGANTWIAGAGTQLVGTGLQYVLLADGTYDLFAITATGFP